MLRMEASFRISEIVYSITNRVCKCVGHTPKHISKTFLRDSNLVPSTSDLNEFQLKPLKNRVLAFHMRRDYMDFIQKRAMLKLWF